MSYSTSIWISLRRNIFRVWDGKVRLSIAGYQDKIAVLEENGLWFLVDGKGLASTHLLKSDPIRSGLQHMTSNEFACMRLAQAAGPKGS